MNSIGLVLDHLVTYGGGVNVYNYRAYGTYNLTGVKNYFNILDIKRNYNVPDNLNYTEANMTVYSYLYTDFVTSKA